jgi:sporulation protein YlmC with PRC-barrel domain
MRVAISAAFAAFLAAATAQAQQTQSGTPAKAQAATPIAGIDDAALARSARASKLIGSKVYQGDTPVGQIEDVLVDLEHATLAAVILSVGGFLGIGEKLVAVPVDRIKIGSEAKFTTDLTKEQLASAPSFDFGKLK